MADLNKFVLSLQNRGFHAAAFETCEEANAYLVSKLAGKSIGLGGCKTLRDMGLDNALLAAGATLLGHHYGATQAQAAAAPVYISSVNGAAETGELINIDGTGNRVAATLYGHKKVYFIVGRNKLAPTYDEALWRARNIAAPRNAQRLQRKTPCAINGDRCYDCKSPDRICRGLVVHWGAMMGMKMEVVLVDEDLGL